jgi:hypothetical protein
MIFITCTSVAVTGFFNVICNRIKHRQNNHNTLKSWDVFFTISPFISVCNSPCLVNGSQVSKFGFFLILIRPPEHRHELKNEPFFRE